MLLGAVARNYSRATACLPRVAHEQPPGICVAGRHRRSWEGLAMKNGYLATCCLLAACVASSLVTACSSATATGEDCSVHCQNVENDCMKKCNDDTCKSQCKTDFNNCGLSCEMVQVSTDGG
jgi:hypothetical protein